MAFDYHNYTESDYLKRLRENMDRLGTYNESDAVRLARDAVTNQESLKPGEWTGGQWGQYLKDTNDKINNREKFKYDLNADMLYQQYKDQYMRQGQIAMQDTMGQAAALTGGYGNSYAATVGNQAYQASLQNLNNIVPQLYQLALDKYNQEGQDLQNQFARYQSLYGNEYGEYRDKVGDWGNELARLTDKYNTERNFDYGQYESNRNYATNAYNNERESEYNRYNTERNFAFGQYQQKVAEDQAAAQLALQQMSLNSNGGNGGGGSGDVLDKYVRQGTDNGDGTITYRNQSGKTQTVTAGTNPYTGTVNPDIYKDGKLDVFSNGYQPKNIGGYPVKKTGRTETVNGIPGINVWECNGQEYIWDGTANAYRLYDKNTRTYK